MKGARFTAPPGVVRLLQEGFPKANRDEVESTANRLTSQCVEAGVPLSAALVKELSTRSPLESVTKTLEAALARVPQDSRRSRHLPNTRKFTIYSRVEASCPLNLRKAAEKRVAGSKRDPVALAVGAQVLTLHQRQSPEFIVNTADRLKAKFEFNLRQESYCQRRLITDANLLKLAATRPDLAALYVYADSCGLKLSGRPKIAPVPYYFAAYYEFYRDHPDHFASLDVVSEIVAVVNNPIFKRLTTVHYANYADQRARWQESRTRQDGMPTNDYVDPSEYTVMWSDKSKPLSVTASALAVKARSAGRSIIDTASHSLPVGTRLRRKIEKNDDAWIKAIAR